MAETPTPKKPKAEVTPKTSTPEPQPPVAEVADQTPPESPVVDVGAPTPPEELAAEAVARTAATELPAAWANAPAVPQPSAIASPEATPPIKLKTTTVATDMTSSNPPETVIVTEESVADKSTSQAQQIKDQILTILSDLPDYISNFYQQYKSPLTAAGLVLASVIALKVFLGIVDALNDIPLLEPTFELIGIAYTGWFVYRYLLRSSNRQELSQSVQRFKEQILGKKA